MFAGDVSFRMTDFALRNAERAGVKQAIELKTADALQRMIQWCHAAGRDTYDPDAHARDDAAGR